MLCRGLFKNFAQTALMGNFKGDISLMRGPSLVLRSSACTYSRLGTVSVAISTVICLLLVFLEIQLERARNTKFCTTQTPAFIKLNALWQNSFWFTLLHGNSYYLVSMLLISSLFVFIRLSLGSMYEQC